MKQQPDFKDLLGVMGAALLDFKWLFIGLFVGALLAASCAKAAESAPDPRHDKNNYMTDMLLQSNSGNSVIVIQHGALGCQDGQRRALQMFQEGLIVIGCSEMTKDGDMVINWETGVIFHISKGFLDGQKVPKAGKQLPQGHTDGPAKEPPSTTLHWSPERNI